MNDRHAVFLVCRYDRAGRMDVLSVWSSERAAIGEAKRAGLTDEDGDIQAFILDQPDGWMNVLADERETG